jgi:hypothetical protein
MQHPTAALPRVLLATVLALAPACSGGDSKPGAESSKGSAHEAKAPANALASLVPADTAIYVQASSIDRLATAIRSVTAAFDPDKAAAMDVDQALASLDVPGSMKEIDRTKPLAICLVLSNDPGAQPSPTYLVPALSPESYAKSAAAPSNGLFQFTAAVHGDYVTVSGVPATPGSPPGAAPSAPAASKASALALDLPAGDVVARLDVRRLVEHFRPMIDMGLSQVTNLVASMPAETTGGMQVGPFLKVYADGLRAVVDSGETLDLAAHLDGNVLELSSALKAREKSALDGFGSPQKTDAKALARYLDPAAPMAMVLGMDQTVMLQRFRPIIDAAFAMYPEPMRSSFQKMMGKADEMAAAMGSAFCVNGALTGDGLRYAVYMRPKDTAKLVATYRSMMASVPGITFDEPVEGEVGGVKVLRSRLKVDGEALMGGAGAAAGEAQQAQMKAMVERMYGPNGLAFTMTTQGDPIAVVLGGDDAFQASSIARLSKPEALPPRVARGLEQVGDLNPCFVMHYDLRAMMKGMQDVMGGAAPGMPFGSADVQATFTVSGGIDGRVWRGALSTDIAEFGASVRKLREPPAGPSGR